MAQLQPYMHIIVMVLTGLVAGWLAHLLLGGGGLIRNIIVGIIGSIVGGFLVQQGLLKIPFDFNAFIPVYGNQIAVSTIGALLVIIIARILGR